MEVASKHDRTIHVGKKLVIVRRVLGVGHDLPPFTEAKQKVWKWMPVIFLLQPVELQLSLVKLEVVQVVQCLSGFNLNLWIGYEDDRRIFSLAVGKSRHTPHQ